MSLNQNPGIKRKNSKFDLQDNQETVLFRPEFSTGGEEKKGKEKMWSLMKSYLGTDTKSIQR